VFDFDYARSRWSQERAAAKAPERRRQNWRLRSRFFPRTGSSRAARAFTQAATPRHDALIAPAESGVDQDGGPEGRRPGGSQPSGRHGPEIAHLSPRQRRGAVLHTGNTRTHASPALVSMTRMRPFHRPARRPRRPAFHAVFFTRMSRACATWGRKRRVGSRQACSLPRAASRSRWASADS